MYINTNFILIKIFSKKYTHSIAFTHTHAPTLTCSLPNLLIIPIYYHTLYISTLTLAKSYTQTHLRSRLTHKNTIRIYKLAIYLKSFEYSTTSKLLQKPILCAFKLIKYEHLLPESFYSYMVSFFELPINNPYILSFFTFITRLTKQIQLWLT